MFYFEKVQIEIAQPTLFIFENWMSGLDIRCIFMMLL
jgi:hypothetical protein